MPRTTGQRNNPVLLGEDAQEALHALAEREEPYAPVILELGQRLLDLDGVGLRNGMGRNPNGSDMASYAIAFTHPFRNITFVGFLTCQQNHRPGAYPQRDLGIRIRIRDGIVNRMPQELLDLLYGPTSESTGDWYNFRRVEDESTFQIIQRVYGLYHPS